MLHKCNPMCHYYLYKHTLGSYVWIRTELFCWILFSTTRPIISFLSLGERFDIRDTGRFHAHELTTAFDIQIVRATVLLDQQAFSYSTCLMGRWDLNAPQSPRVHENRIRKASRLPLCPAGTSIIVIRRKQRWEKFKKQLRVKSNMEAAG